MITFVLLLRIKRIFMRLHHYISLSIITLFISCSQPVEYVTINGTMLGTTLNIIADIKNTPTEDIYQAVMKIDKEAKISMSIFEENSLINRINRNQTDSVDIHITNNLKLAKQFSVMSNGIYDVTVKPLVQAWGFAGKKRIKSPNIDSILEFVGYEKVKIESGRLVKDDPRLELDFNSIAKGYTVDLVADLVESLGSENYLVDIGGEIRCRGKNREGGPWRIGVETPFDGNMTNGGHLQTKIQINDGAMATSGNYRRFYITESGEKIAHTIDPTTGHSAISSLLSVTVIADDCATADAMGTMFLALGAERALLLAKKLNNIKVYFIFADKGGSYKEYISPQMEILIMKN